MKKLFLGKALEESKATCDFCGETEKDCVRGIPAKMYYRELESIMVPKSGELELKLSFLGKTTWYCKDWKYAFVEKGEPLSKDRQVDICKDCIKQLSKLI